MTQEEKARAYDEAIKRAIKHRNEDPLTLEQYETIAIIFPKLGEGEESKDDKIRKVIRGWIYARPSSFFDNGISKEEMLAWIEKKSATNETINNDKFAQGVLRGAAINLITWIDCNAAEGNTCLSNTECKDIVDALVKGDWDKIYSYIKKKLEKQGDKSQGKTALEAIHEEKVYNVNKIESEFHEGDWVVISTQKEDKTVQIASVQYFTKDGYPSYITTEARWFGNGTKAHLWTIADAKDGDVLAVGNEVFIYAHRKQMYSIAIAHCFVNSAGVFYLDGEFGYMENGNSIHPATKEQRDLLFQKMKEAGYEWDADKKELRKTENSPILSNSSNTGKQWTEEDEHHWMMCLECVEECATQEREDFSKTIDWLNSLKQRLQ